VRLAVILTALLLAANLLMGVSLVNRSKTALKSLIHNRMLDIANTAAHMLDGDTLETLTKEDRGTAPYQAVNDALAVFQENIELEYIYTVRALEDGSFVFLVDPTVKDPGEFGEPVVCTEALQKAALGRPAVDEEPYSDQWGRFYSAYSPVLDSQGRVAGIVAVDFSAAWYDREISQQNRSIIVNCLLSVALGLALIWLGTRRLRRQLRDITGNIADVARDVDDLTHKIGRGAAERQEGGADSVQELSGKIRLVKEDLRQYINSLHSQTNSMITALGSDYRSVYYLDLDQDAGICFQAMADIDNGLQPGQRFDYMKEITRYANEAVTDQYREAFLHFVQPDTIRAGLEKERLITFLYTVHRNGTDLYEMVRVAGVRHPEDRDDHIVHAVGMGFTDVDAETRKTLAQSDALREALAAAEEANKAKTAFLSNMSHEIRTPMNAIIGLDSLALRTEGLPAETKEYLEKIGGSARHLLGLINDILDMSRIESGRLTLRREEFSFSGMLEQINTMVMSQCGEKGLKYECRVIGGVSDFYIGDDMKLKQVLINILSNAIKFTEAPGSVILTVERTAVYGDHSTMKFSVKDTGIGMNPSFIPKIFDTFTQEDSSRNNKYGSTGLGMAITKNIVELMNGTISVESQKGVGSEFTVVVTLTNSKHEGPAGSAINPKDMHILVVDDEEVAAEHARIVLDEVGIQADTCGSGHEALQMLEVQHTKHQPYNLVLLDWKMPEMDGIEVTREIRKRYDKETTVIILTSFNWDEIMDEALHVGVDSFLAKPLFASNVIDEFERIARRNSMSLFREKQRASLEGRRILLAEDIVINAEIMKQIILMRNAQIDHAENGRIVVDMFQNSPVGYYDAVLMDVRMPEMDGLEATAVIRALDRPDAKRVPIIALTANAFDEDVQRSLQVGMNAHLSKPVEPEHLYRTLEELIWEADQKA